MNQKSFIVFLFSLLFFNSISQAQTKPDTLLAKKIANEVCGCLNKVDLSNTMSSVFLTTESNDCMNKSLYKFRKELNFYAELSESEYTAEIGEKMSRKVGMVMFPYLMRDCKKFFELMVMQFDKMQEESEKAELYSDSLSRVDEYYADSTYNDSTYNYEEYDESQYTIKGKLKAIETKNYTYLIIEDEKGVKNKLLWLHYFENSDAISRNFKKYKDKKVSVQWYESEIYDPKEKLYIKNKEISWFEFLEE